MNSETDLITISYHHQYVNTLAIDKTFIVTVHTSIVVEKH